MNWADILIPEMKKLINNPEWDVKAILTHDFSRILYTPEDGMLIYVYEKNRPEWAGTNRNLLMGVVIKSMQSDHLAVRCWPNGERTSTYYRMKNPDSLGKMLKKIAKILGDPQLTNYADVRTGDDVGS
jgi:hypothetical protein